MADTVTALAARLKYEHACGRIELTDDLIGREADAHHVTAERLRRAIADAVLDQWDSGGPPLQQ